MIKYFENENGTLWLGDCLQVMGRLPDLRADLLLTDPPYLIGYKSGRRLDKSHDFCSGIAGDDDFGLVSSALRAAFGTLRNNRAAYVFCSTAKVDWFKNEIEKHSKIKNMIIWVKNNHTAGDLSAAFGRKYEILFLCNRGRRTFNGKRLTDVWEFDRVSGPGQVHQNQKPLDLLLRCIAKHSDPGDVVFDPFGGSGGTALAAERLGRKWVLIEKEPKYCEIIVNRIKDGR